MLLLLTLAVMADASRVFPRSSLRILRDPRTILKCIKILLDTVLYCHYRCSVVRSSLGSNGPLNAGVPPDLDDSKDYNDYLSAQKLISLTDLEFNSSPFRYYHLPLFMHAESTQSRDAPYFRLYKSDN
jgi:hypothetical protein